MTPTDALRNARPRIQAAVAQGSFLACQEAQAAGASEHDVAAILKAYAWAWKDLEEWLDERGATV
ncbi:hypothetical protein [Isoptericola haloaureus]|uniref:Uncharacterized protein n=1 Tax=Isoptericola haloaureus TaxID=1542902 RepID=A0ABU7Z851_9MICO